MLAVFVTVLSLMSVGHSAPPACEKSVRPLVQFDPLDMVGRWALVAASVKNPVAESILKGRHSVAVDLYNSSYTQANLEADGCQYDPKHFSVEGHRLKMRVSTYNLTVTLFHTSCPDCALLTLEVEGPRYKSLEFDLFSKRRQLEQSEMEEFRAQVECLNMPPPVVMDPSKDLCPEQKTSDPGDQTEKTA